MASIANHTLWTYKQISNEIGNPKAVRVVGMVNNKNPLPIFLPCHRVIGANGSLTGYGEGCHKAGFA